MYMPKATKGFLAHDGTFFEKREECAVYETRALLALYLTAREIDPDQIIPIIKEGADLIREYINAENEAAIKRAVEEHRADNRSGQDEALPVQQQSSDGD
jgi:hypothetical protein